MRQTARRRYAASAGAARPRILPDSATLGDRRIVLSTLPHASRRQIREAGLTAVRPQYVRRSVTGAQPICSRKTRLRSYPSEAMTNERGLALAAIVHGRSRHPSEWLMARGAAAIWFGVLALFLTIGVEGSRPMSHGWLAP